MGSELDMVLRVVLVLLGAGVGVHYFLISNFIVAAPHWLRSAALPCAVGSAMGMIVCGFSGLVVVGLVCSLVAHAAMMLVQFEAWRSGAHVSKQLAEAAQFKKNKAAMIRDWVISVQEFHEDLYGDPLLDKPQPQRQPRRERVTGG